MKDLNYQAKADGEGTASLRNSDQFRCKDKQSLCQVIAGLQTQVNELALALSIADGPELHEVWLNLANARAYLTTALDAARGLRQNEIYHYQI